jgi:hypothetical protein
MLPGLLSQCPALIGEGLVYSRDLLFDSGDRFSRPGDLYQEGLAVRPRLLGPLERIGAAGVRVGHDEGPYPSNPWTYRSRAADAAISGTSAALVARLT